jgi:outer membrane protein assembly factor BamB
MRKLIICLVSFVFIASTFAFARTWTDTTGRYRIEAEFVSFANGNVSLKKQDGSTVEVPMSKLSSADQKWIRDELKRRRSTPSSSPTIGSSNMTSGDWPQWRGPNRDGISTETGLLNSWPNDGPPLLWSTRGAGRGYSSVAVSDGRIYTMGNRGSSEDLIAFDEKSGDLLWSTRVGGGKDCNCTPTVSDGLVFALGREGDLLCADAKTGREVWRKSFPGDFGGKMMSMWGYSESPLVDGDRVIVTPGGTRAMVAALDKRTGRTIWQTPMAAGGSRGKDGAGYSSVVISDAAGVKQYVTLVGRGVISVDAKDGKPLWHYERVANGTANVPTPIVKGDYIFCSSGYGDGGSALLKIEKQGNRVGFREVYYRKNSELQNHHGGMILIGDHVYMGHGHNNGFPVCVNMLTGQPAWGPQRGPGRESAAIAAADGHLYFRYQDGTMALIEATPARYNLKGSFRIASVNGESWPHPAIANGKLYLRDQDQLHCYDIRQQ